MSLRSLLTDPVEITTTGPSPGRDALGKPLPGPTTRQALNGRLRLASSDEIARTDGLTANAWTLTLPPEAVVDSGAEVVANGRRFEVDGTPDYKHAPGGGLSFYTVLLKDLGGTE